MKLTIVDAGSGTRVRRRGRLPLALRPRRQLLAVLGRRPRTRTTCVACRKPTRAAQLSFQTIYPACYSGRWPHMHFEVYPSLDEATKAGSKLATSQIALLEDTSKAVYATDGYEAERLEPGPGVARHRQRVQRRRRAGDADRHRFGRRRLRHQPDGRRQQLTWRSGQRVSSRSSAAVATVATGGSSAAMRLEERDRDLAVLDRPTVGVRRQLDGLAPAHPHVVAVLVAEPGFEHGRRHRPRW